MTDAAASELKALAPPPPLWRRVLPWAIGLAMIAWLVARADVDGLVRALAHVNKLAFAAFIATFSTANLLTDVFAAMIAYRLTVTPKADYRTLLVMRGASYLPSLANFHIGQAYMTFVLANLYGASLMRVAAGTLVVYVTTMGTIVTLAALALPLSVRALPSFGLPIALVTAAGGLYLAVLAWKPTWLANRKIVAPLFETGALGHVKILIARLPHMIVSAAGLWGTYAFFGVPLTFVEALTFLPILMVVSVLPITPGGIGTRETIAILLIGAKVSADPKEASSVLTGAGILWTAGTLTASALIGIALTPLANRVTAHARAQTP